MFTTLFESIEKNEAITSFFLCGAGDGNRTRAASLGSWNSTIELHPRKYETLKKQINKGLQKKLGRPQGLPGQRTQFEAP